MHSKSTLISAAEIKLKLAEKSLLIDTINVTDNQTFSGMQTDSRKVSKGDVFICIFGFIVDGHGFAKKAVKKGTRLLIVEKELDLDIPQIVVLNSRKATAILATLFYNDPSKKLKIIGITGTNGKTTISSILERILRDNGRKVGLIGTLGYTINGVLYKTERTTPDIIDLHEIFIKMIEAKVEFVVMEVSSHALSLDRTFAIHFHSAVFSNLTQDHLDFHANINEYAKTKYKLFKNTDKAFINVDDEHGQRLYDKCSFTKFGISFIDGEISIGEHEYGITGSSFNLKFMNDKFLIKTKLIGKYNIFNIATAFSVALDLLGKAKAKKVIDSISKIDYIPGRLELVKNQRNIGVYIDYAHTPDALENVVKTLNEIKTGKIICVFGAGGERDKTKRPKMLQAAKSADKIIITNDNPRNEETADIIRDIIKDSNKDLPFWIIRNRRAAIQAAVSFANSEDIVLIAGKGHEKYQEVKGKKLEFDDIEVAKKALVQSNEFNTSLSLLIDPVQLEMIFEQNLIINNDELIEHISTDSRTIKENSLFFALKGENFDGHDYVDKVLKTNNCWAIVNNEFEGNHGNLIRVKNTTEAYAHLARKYKQQFNTTTIAITGSYGKTTTKEYLYNILSEVSPTHKTFGNENNLFGVPLTLFRLDPRYMYSVIELGTNQFGEIKKLTEMTEPDFGVITAIGASHLEHLGDEDGVFKEKSALFHHDLKQKFFPADDIRFRRFSGKSFGVSTNADFEFSRIITENNSTHFMVNDVKFSIPTPFKQYAMNAGLAIVIATELKIEKKVIQKGLDKPLQISQRMEIIKQDGKILLVDCYNANPDSMKAALEFWSEYEQDKPHIAILGDMLELGKLTNELHENMLPILKNINYEKLISVGDRSRLFNADEHFEDVDDLLSSGILDDIPPNAVILIKASHGIKLEKIIGRI